jgi:hypothetical protein
VSTDTGNDLRAAFEEASEFVQPRPGLTDSVRRAARRGRRRLATAIAATTAIVLAIAVGGYLAAGLRHRTPVAPRKHPWHAITLPPESQVGQLAATGRYLYVLESNVSWPVASLSAYDRSTGKLVRTIGVPAAASALAIGPAGLVWLAFYPDQNGGPTGIWLLSPDLSHHSAGPATQTSIIVPTGPTTALVPTQYGLLRIRIPLPGASGRATQALLPRTSLGPPMNTAPGVSAALLGGRVAVQVTDGYGFHSHVVIAGSPNTTFGGGKHTVSSVVVSAGGSLWVAAGGNSSGPLYRLNRDLRPTTPDAIRLNPMLRHTENVWSSGQTIWVALGLGKYGLQQSLACFTAGSQIGPVTTLRVAGEVDALAAIGGTVYITSGPPNTPSAGVITSYRIPAACR